LEHIDGWHQNNINQDTIIKIDIFAFGSILNEMCTGQKPFHEIVETSLIYKMLELNKRPSLANNRPQKLNDLILQCWSSNPNDRPEFIEIYERLEIILQEIKNSENSRGNDTSLQSILTAISKVENAILESKQTAIIEDKLENGNKNIISIMNQILQNQLSNILHQIEKDM